MIGRLSFLLLVLCIFNSCSKLNKSSKKETKLDSISTKEVEIVDQSTELETTLEIANNDVIELLEEPIFYDSMGRPNRPVFRNIKVDTSELFGVWTQDLTYPNAEFLMSEKYYYIADYDGDGRIPYILEENLLTVFFEYEKSTGKIEKVGNDSLLILWNHDDPNRKYQATYFRFDN
ncbi:MAG: hypothetical protein JXR03_09590 [Cyclobacteriaceae bacterium]